jgi:hypothetical protein
MELAIGKAISPLEVLNMKMMVRSSWKLEQYSWPLILYERVLVS